MKRPTAALFAAFAVATLALAPAIAEARVGGRSSAGSRGSQTYTAPPATRTAPGGAQQFQRTETPAQRPGTAATPQTAQRPVGAPGGLFGRSPLMAGLMGGLLGAGLFGLLSGAGLFGGLSGFAGFLGLMLQIALIAGLVFVVMRLIRGRQQPAMAGGPQGYARDMHAGGRPMGGAAGGAAMGGAIGGAAVARHPIEIGAADFEAFERTLVEMNEAWTRQDVGALRRLSTPEMARYFEGDLEDLKARGWTNAAHDVKLESGDLSEAWQENGQDYATVAMRFSLVDVTTDAGGNVVEGNPTERETATEMWTFTRRPGTRWTLSAIQQTS
ncbi:MAG TPA: TIM44-like domain-containing protein [Falsiroseomonas sp.]|jgi:predicted lipid-binding transport protein (Tim44 family)|nr:TIM44-like domain-containing protein [Falsiroseomonas sp.]